MGLIRKRAEEEVNLFKEFDILILFTKLHLIVDEQSPLEIENYLLVFLICFLMIVIVFLNF